MGAVGYGISAALSIAAAMKAKEAYALQAKQSQEAADMAGIQADQEAINRTAQLNAQLASISATASAGGVSVGTSGSFKNIGRRETKLANADISAIKMMGRQNRRKFMLDSKASKMKGDAALISGLASAASSGSKAYYANKTGTG
tara:strand:+ start:293 stop:727 length:435 start_codon:yes stop_codon:yes gene_type:complete